MFGLGKTKKELLSASSKEVASCILIPVIVSELLQPSVTVTEYVPAVNPDTSCALDVNPLGPIHE